MEVCVRHETVGFTCLEERVHITCLGIASNAMLLCVVQVAVCFCDLSSRWYSARAHVRRVSKCSLKPWCSDQLHLAPAATHHNLLTRHRGHLDRAHDGRLAGQCRQTGDTLPLRHCPDSMASRGWHKA